MKLSLTSRAFRLSLVQVGFAILGVVQTTLPSSAQTSRASGATERLHAIGSSSSNTKEPEGKEPEAAIVTLSEGLLTVDANNSELSQILGDVSRQSGMIIQGDIRKIRVFGRYGPQNPSVILSELLSGLGYNIAMTGAGRFGVPKELMLSDRTGTASPPAPQPVEPVEPVLGPGAIPHPRDEEADDPQLRNYRHDQRLQHMREAMEQQQGGSSR